MVSKGFFAQLRPPVSVLGQSVLAIGSEEKKLLTAFFVGISGFTDEGVGATARVDGDVTQ